MCGLSPSQISKIETGNADPSVAVLARICSALEVTAASVLASAEDAAPAIHPLRAGEAMMMRRLADDQVSEEILHISRNAVMQPEIIVFPPGATSGAPLRHSGEEFFYVLTGSVIFFFGNEESLTMSAGDSIYFDCSIPHRWENSDPKEEARILVVTSPPPFLTLQRPKL